MGVHEVDRSLAGVRRTTLSTEPADVRRTARSRIPHGTDGVNGVYDRNILIAELNALNAALAVIAWLDAEDGIEATRQIAADHGWPVSTS